MRKTTATVRQARLAASSSFELTDSFSKDWVGTLMSSLHTRQHDTRLGQHLGNALLQ